MASTADRSVGSGRVSCKCWGKIWDYVYATWWRCRVCGSWHEVVPASTLYHIAEVGDFIIPSIAGSEELIAGLENLGEMKITGRFS